jgi:hypothetical protein
MGQALALATIVTMISQANAGGMQNAGSQYQAKQQEIAGTQSLAAGQREGMQETRKADYVGSRARAIAAGSGAGATDPGVIKIQSDIAAEGEYNTMSALYQGVEAKRVGNADAALSRYAGRSAQTAGYLKAGATLLSGGSSLYDKYGGGRMPGPLIPRNSDGTLTDTSGPIDLSY